MHYHIEEIKEYKMKILNRFIGGYGYGSPYASNYAAPAIGVTKTVASYGVAPAVYGGYSGYGQ